MGFGTPYDVDRASEQWYSDYLNDGHHPTVAAAEALNNYTRGAKSCRQLFQKELLREKIAWEAEHESFVTDRATIDQVAYAAFHDIEALSMEDIETAKAAAGRYDIIFHAPIDAFHDLGADPARKEDLVYHTLFQIFLDGFNVAWGSGTYAPELSMSDLEERKTFVAQMIKKFERNCSIMELVERLEREEG
jgi:hypothetical protein